MTYGKQVNHAPGAVQRAGDPSAAPAPGRSTLVQQLATRAGTAAVQRKQVGAATAQEPAAAAQDGVAGSGGALPFLDTIQRAFGTHDVGGVEAHTDGAARDASLELGAHAYAFGNHVAFAGTPDLHTTAHEAAHVVQQRAGVSLKNGVGEVGDAYERHADAVADLVVAGHSAEALLGELAPGGSGEGIQKREINPDGEYDRMTNAAANLAASDWLRSDRVGNTPRWQEACLTNLLAGDSPQYMQIDERRDFYHWFYEAACARGYETRWMLAAYLVANGASQVASMDATALQAFGNSITNVAPVGLQAAMRQGNQLIFDNVFPKLKRLWLGGPLRGAAALQWDMQTLSEEQALVQPMYNSLGANLGALNHIAHQWGLWVGLGMAITSGANVAAGTYNKPGAVPGLPDTADITDPLARWRYGMSLGNTFAPTATGYSATTAMPAVGPDYQMNGTTNAAFDAVNRRPGLHALEAYLNPAYIGDRRDGTASATANLDAIIAGLTEPEKQTVLVDRMPDGNRYSTSMGVMGGVAIGFTVMYGVTDDQAARCLPAGGDAAAVEAFMSNLRAVRGSHVRSA